MSHRTDTASARVIAAASAPGKLFVAGEYAVLARGWCVVTATDRRVAAQVLDQPAGYHVEGADLSDDARLPQAALDASATRAGITLDHLRADVRALYHAGEKLGLGSSAASTVALVAALQAAAAPPRAWSDEDVAETWRASLRAHRALQGGRGSHADVAASAWGGWLAYRMAEAQAPFPALARPAQPDARTIDGAEVVRLSWPGCVRLEAIWTQAPARSVSLIRQVEAALAARPDAARDVLDEIARTAERLIAWMRADDPDADAGLGVLAAGEVAMDRLGRLASAPILTEAHRALSTHAVRWGCVAKPAGAGGGDFSLIAGPQSADWPALLAGLPAGCQHVPMRLGQPGVSAS